MVNRIVSILIILTCSSLASAQIVAEENFDDLTPGTQPNCGEYAGAWGWPNNYIDAHLCECHAQDFSVVASDSVVPDALGSCLRLWLSGEDPEACGRSIHLPFLLDHECSEVCGELVIVRFDIFVEESVAGGGIYLSKDHGGGGFGEDPDRGPQLEWREDGKITRGPGRGENGPQVVLDDYPRRQWQSIRLEVNLSADTYAIWWGPRDAAMSRLVDSAVFCDDNALDGLDRFTVYHNHPGFDQPQSVLSYIDNLQIEVTEAPRSELPITGIEIPELNVLDQTMIDFMSCNEIGAGLLSIMKDGIVVFHKAYGWHDEMHSMPLHPQALMRIASITKPITAAAIRQLEAADKLSLEAQMFNLGQPGGGILELDPYPSLGDPRLAEITVKDCLDHKGGWDRGIAGDLTFREIVIANDMGIPSPPGRINTARWILGQPLQHDPGTTYAYSNIGYMFLGLVIERVSGQRYLEYIREQVFGSLPVSPCEVQRGRTFLTDQDPREPWYSFHYGCHNVHDPNTSTSCPYGGWDHEARLSQGGLVASTVALLHFLETHWINGSQIGGRRTGNEGGEWRLNKRGTLYGTDAIARQRWDGFNFVVLFNKTPFSGIPYGIQIKPIIDNILDDGTLQWPTESRETTVMACPEPRTITVDQNGSGDHTEIQPAIDAAQNGDEVLVSPGEYVISEPIDFNQLHDPENPEGPPVKNIVLRSKEGPETTIIRMTEWPPDANRASVVIFENGETGDSLLEGFTLVDGKGTAPSPADPLLGGGILCLNSSPTVVSCVITGNRANNGLGGGVYCGNSSARFKNCMITENRAADGGGFHYESTGNHSLETCTVVRNRAHYGGGIVFRDSHTVVTNCRISENRALWGGGVYCVGAEPFFATCHISHNGDGIEGSAGGIFCEENSSPGFLDCVVSGNFGVFEGGISCIEGSVATFRKCTIVDNLDSDGSLGVCVEEDSLVTLTSCIVWDNIIRPPERVQATYCCIQGEAPFPGDDNIAADPLMCALGRWESCEDGSPEGCDCFGIDEIGSCSHFLRWIEGDYRLRTDSPCIGAGEDGVNMGADLGLCAASPWIKRGDANADNTIDIADAIFTLSYLFAEGPAPSCLDAADANDDGAADIADAIAVLSHLFANAGDLPEPFGECGLDPTVDELGCSSYPPCEGR